MHYAYILYSPSADKYYVGQTPELETRLLFHNELSERSFTARYRPWTLERVIAVNNRSEAMLVERYIKARKSKHYIRRLIEEGTAVESILEKFEISPPGNVG